MDTIGLDVGGTSIVAAVVDERGRLLVRHRVRTPDCPADVVPLLCDLIARLRRGHAVTAVGVAAAGFVNAERTHVVFAKHIGWANEPLQEQLARHTGLPVVLENDANAAAWAETRFGAAQGEAVTVAVTIGTGIGGGIIADGQPMRGGAGMAAELGHLCVVRDGRPCGCGGLGCWEMYASGSALQEAGRRMLADDSAPAAAFRLAVSGSDAASLTGPQISKAAAQGNPGAVELVRELGEWVGRGLASLAAVLDPTCFVLGGGVAATGSLLLAPTQAALQHHLPGRRHRPPIRVTTALLGPDAGVIGAADLARRRDDTGDSRPSLSLFPAADEV